MTTTQPNHHLLNSASNFKATYLRVLMSKEPLAQDRWAAKELIDGGYATGKVLLSQSRADYGAVQQLLAFAPTVQGRTLADELAQSLRQATWRYRLGKLGIGALGFVSGWLLGVTTELGKAMVMRLF